MKTQLITLASLILSVSVLPKTFANEIQATRTIEVCREPDTGTTDAGHVVVIEKTSDGSYAAFVFKNTVFGIQEEEKKAVTKEFKEGDTDYVGEGFRLSIIKNLENSGRSGILSTQNLGALEVICEQAGRMVQRKNQ